MDFWHSLLHAEDLAIRDQEKTLASLQGICFGKKQCPLLRKIIYKHPSENHEFSTNPSPARKYAILGPFSTNQTIDWFSINYQWSVHFPPFILATFRWRYGETVTSYRRKGTELSPKSKHDIAEKAPSLRLDSEIRAPRWAISVN